jgi:dihydroorotate dehydrogenase electron transfer subunit
MAERTIYTAMRVAGVRPEGDVGVTLTLDAPLPAEPGQFAMLWLPGLAERPYTIMESEPLNITVARVGRFSEALCALEQGQRLWVRGPYGCGFALEGRRHLLVGGGSGTASLTLLARLALARGDEVTAIAAARSAERLMLAWRLAELGAKVILATDDGSAGLHGNALDAARPLLESGWPDALYACGPEVMLRALAHEAQARALPCWVSLERVMKCAMGVCGNCACGDRLVCRDGPVFSGATLLEATL